MTDALRNFLSGRRTAYVQIFSGPNAKIVLEDLARFCRANETTFHENPRVAALQEGRREVWLRIQQHLNLSPEELFDLISSGSSATVRIPVQSDDTFT